MVDVIEVAAGILQVIGTAIVAIVLTTWLAVTVANQFERGRALIGPVLQLDVLALIPSWTFFAPDPGRTDTHLVYRDVYEAGTFAYWRSLRLSSRPTLFGLSHGERRVAKGVVDLLPELLESSRTPLSEAADGENVVEANQLYTAPKRVMFSNAYLAILSLVTQADHDPFAVGVQFALAISDGPEREINSRLVFISAIHALGVEPQPQRG